MAHSAGNPRRVRLLVCLLALLALVSAGCGGSGKQGGKAQRNGMVNVGQVLKRGEQLGTPSVRGRVFPLSGSQLVLAGKQRSLILMAKPALAKQARKPGQAVMATGPVRRLSPSQAKKLAEALAKRAKRAPKPPPEVTRAERKAGTPYVELQRLKPAAKAKPPG